MRIFNESTNKRIISVLKEVPLAIKIHQGVPGTAYFRTGEKNISVVSGA